MRIALSSPLLRRNFEPHSPLRACSPSHKCNTNYFICRLVPLRAENVWYINLHFHTRIGRPVFIWFFFFSFRDVHSYLSAIDRVADRFPRHTQTHACCSCGNHRHRKSPLKYGPMAMAKWMSNASKSSPIYHLRCGYVFQQFVQLSLFLLHFDRLHSTYTRVICDTIILHTSWI